MSNIERLHNAAMVAADRGDLAVRRKRIRTARRFFAKALNLERRAARGASACRLEPTASILNRSADALASLLGGIWAPDFASRVRLIGSFRWELIPAPTVSSRMRSRSVDEMIVRVRPVGGTRWGSIADPESLLREKIGDV